MMIEELMGMAIHEPLSALSAKTKKEFASITKVFSHISEITISSP